MQGLRYAAIDMMLRAITLSGADRWLGPRLRGKGCILTFHRVTEEAPPLLPENAGLNITPAFLDTVLTTLKGLGYDIISLDDLPARLEADGPPFAVLTFDDGYCDTRDLALPVLERHGAPFTCFICAGFATRAASLWWLDLEEVVGRVEALGVLLPTGPFAAPARNRGEKRAALRALYWRLRELDEADLRTAVATLCREAGVDPAARVARLCMDVEALSAFARHPLVSLGAHSMTHPRLGFLPEADARAEMAQSARWLEETLGVPARHFCYPVGDARSAGAREAGLARALGFATGLTTRPGVLHAGADLHHLPRISVNGLFQRASALRALVSGVPFAGR